MLRIFLMVLCVVNLTITAAFAEEAQSSASSEEWNPPSAGPITTSTAPLCAKGEFVIQPLFFYNRTRGAFDSEGHYDGLPAGDSLYQYQEVLFMQYGITDRLEIDGQLLYQENYIKQGGLKAHASGLGDSYLFLRYCMFEEKEWFPHVTGVFALKAPTGKYQHAYSDKLGTDIMGDGSWDQGIGMILTKKLKPFIVHADAYYSFSQPTKIDGVKTRYANYLNYDVGVEYFLPKGFNLLLEMNGFVQGDIKMDSEYIPSSDSSYITICPGIGWSNEKIALLLAYLRIVVGKNADANDSVVLTCVHTF